MDINANVNNVNCIVQKKYLGYDLYHNICTGTSTTVDWTVWNWLGTGSLFLVIAILLCLFVGLIVSVIKG